MKFRTKVSLPTNLPLINHADNLLLMGSCFAESMGQMLVTSKFRCDVNPFGILYNPFSVLKALDEIMEGKLYTADDLFLYNELYNSYMHHGSFSSPDLEESLASINLRLQQAHKRFPNLKSLFITFGSSWVYELKESGGIVSNCHKVPERNFNRRRLSVEEIVTAYEHFIRKMLVVTPECKVIFTVSPIRHIKDGMHENQLSKATLLLAVDALQTMFSRQVFYFSSYEILLDELRDYRFYNEDMYHPSAVAVDYIWERFEACFFNEETQNIIKECKSIHRDLQHKPLKKGSEVYKSFLEQIVLKINRLTAKYPNLDVEKELEQCRTQLNLYPNR